MSITLPIWHQLTLANWTALIYKRNSMFHPLFFQDLQLHRLPVYITSDAL